MSSTRRAKDPSIFHQSRYASSSMTLVVGNTRRGKSFSARSWCEQHPGKARFIEVPTGNDETSFYRAIARGLNGKETT
jgi:hypothetical protein